MIDSLAENFIMIFSEFCSYATDTCLKTPSSVDVSDAQENPKPELSELENNAIFAYSFQPGSFTDPLYFFTSI
jgi:hypothetical protein